MNELMLFQKEEFGQVRVVERNGEPWFVAKDVAVALGYASTNMTTVFQAVPGQQPLPKGRGLIKALVD